jgi:uncharacterized protein (TIGR01244 family)
MLYCLRSIVSPRRVFPGRAFTGVVFASALVALGLSSLAAAEDEHFAEPRTLSSDGFQQVFSQIGPRIYIGGQPTEAGLARAKALGVTTVVNLRTDFEMNDRDTVPFDEAAEIERLGMQYVHIPQGGPNTAYSPEAVERFAQAVAKADGNVLLHCTVAWRASHLWTAYLIRYQDVPVSDAIAIGKRVNLGGMPLEGFLGQEITYDLK